jgi:hypothetical protein
MKFLILGDVHGCWTDLNITIAKAIREHPDITHIVQVGDFGYGWTAFGGKPFKASRGFLSQEEMDIYKAATKLWLDGNHENFDIIDVDGGAWQPEWIYMRRGDVLETPREDGSIIRAMFFGGASSIDKAQRTPHVSWWPQESITYGQVQRTLATIGNHKPMDVIFSHEHPTAVPYADARYEGNIFGQGDKDLLDVLRKHYRPKYWFFGHHHVAAQGEVESMKWTCCPIIESHDYVIWDGNDPQYSWERHD